MNNLGFRERQILKALEGTERLFLRDVLPERFTPSEYSALMRSAHLLQKRGLIRLNYLTRGPKRIFAERVELATNG